MDTLCKRAARLLAALTLFACGCNALGGLVATRVEVRGARRTLEEQVLGAFERIGEEVFVLAGVRAVDPVSGVPSPPRPMTASEAAALAARRRMEFNRDDVLAFRRAGYVGEGNDWQLVLFEEPLAELGAADPRAARLVREIVREENQDRLTIMRRIVDTTPELEGAGGLVAAGRVMADAYRREAGPGASVQLPDGTWAVTGERP